MKFFHPQIQLVRQPVFDQPDAYYLHVVTFCPRTNFRANGYEVDDQDLADGYFTVRIKLLQDPALPDFQYITPVVHTLSLGSIAFPDGEGAFVVQVVGDVPEPETGGARSGTKPPTTTTKTGGTGTVSTSDADSKARPLDENAL